MVRVSPRVWLFQSEPALCVRSFKIGWLTNVPLSIQTFGRPSGLCGINLFQIPLVTNVDDDVSVMLSRAWRAGLTGDSLP